jgi:hypothetical protein
MHEAYCRGCAWLVPRRDDADTAREDGRQHVTSVTAS